jgi:hypothetical protein
MSNTVSLVPPRPTSVADVLMRVAHDGPLYAVIGLVFALAWKGGASATEVIITSLGGLLARSVPPSAFTSMMRNVGMPALALVLLARLSVACVPVQKTDAGTIQTVVTIADDVCKVAGDIPGEPAWVELACQVEGGLVHVRMKRSTALAAHLIDGGAGK